MLRIFFLILIIYIILFSKVSETLIQGFIESLMPISVFAFLNGIYWHLFFAFFYLHFIQIMDRTPTTRIMVELESSSKKKMTQEELENHYSFDRKISNVLEDMVTLGRLKKENDFYVMTDVGIMHMKIFKFIRNYLRLKRN